MIIDSRILQQRLEDNVSVCHQALFRNVSNMKQLRSEILNNKLKCCLLKSSVIVDPFVVNVAANKAILDEQNQCMKTKSIYTEILYNLSSSKNIRESLIQMSVDDFDRETLLVVVTKNGTKKNKIEDKTNDEMDDVLELIKGDMVSFGELKEMRNEKLICELHGIGEKELTVSTLLNSVLSHMAFKPFK